VQPIAAIVDRPHLCRDLGVAKRSIEVGDAIESVGLADPFVDRNTVLLDQWILYSDPKEASNR